MENFIVLTWLKLIYPELPKLVKQRNGTELRSRILASIKPEISQALTSLLDEIRTADDAKIMRTIISSYVNLLAAELHTRRTHDPTAQPGPVDYANKPVNPIVGSECSFLPEQDRKYIAKARQIANIFDDPLNLRADPERMNQSVTPTTPDQAQAPMSSAYRLTSHHTWTCSIHSTQCT